MEMKTDVNSADATALAEDWLIAWNDVPQEEGAFGEHQ